MTPEEFFSVIYQPPVPVFYRLYHDEQGRALFYSMEDVPGTYIEIDQADYIRSSMRVRVTQGRLMHIAWKTVSKLVPSQQGTNCHALDVCVVTGPRSTTAWSKRTYDTH